MFITFVISLPDPIKGLITFVLTLVLTWAIARLTDISPWLGMLLGRFKDQIIASVSLALVLWIEKMLNLLVTYNPAWEAVLNLILQLIVALLVLIGLPVLILKAFRRQQRFGLKPE